jgi:hypothetical protein
MEARTIIEMEGKKTRIYNMKVRNPAYFKHQKHNMMVVSRTIHSGNQAYMYMDGCINWYSNNYV